MPGRNPVKSGMFSARHQGAQGNVPDVTAEQRGHRAAGLREKPSRVLISFSLLNARQRQDAREDAIGIEIFARELPRGERMSGIVSLNRLEAPRRALEVSIGEQPQPYREMPTEAGILHHHRPPGGQVATASLAKPAALPEGTDRSHGRELASRSVYILAIRVWVSDPLAGGHDPPPVGAQFRQLGIR